MRLFHVSGLFLVLGTPDRREPGPCQVAAPAGTGQAPGSSLSGGAQGSECWYRASVPTPPPHAHLVPLLPQVPRSSHTGPGDLQTRLGSHQRIYAPAVPSAQSNVPTHTPSHAGFFLSNLSSKVTSSEDHSWAVSITASALFPAEPSFLSEMT